MRLRGESLDTERAGVVMLQPLNGLCDLLALTARRRHLAQTGTLLAHQ
jgi:hypothetical protein